MNVHLLAKGLRKRLARTYDTAQVRALRDDQVVSAYLLCAKCNGDIFANRAAAVENSTSVEEFVTLCDMALASHHCQNRN
jgi:hypothetical protein